MKKSRTEDAPSGYSPDSSAPAAGTDGSLEAPPSLKRKRPGDAEDDIIGEPLSRTPPASGTATSSTTTDASPILPASISSSSSGSNTATASPLPTVPPNFQAGGSRPSKRAAEIATEDLDNQTNGTVDMLFIHSGESQERGQPAVCELDSPPRVAPHVAGEGVGHEWSLDLTTTDSQGRAWDFDDESSRQRARDLVNKTRPLLLIGSPMCTWFSTLRNLNKGRVSAKDFEKKFKRACRHLAFVFELYELQVQGGRYFLHEHPASATSWKQKPVVDFIARHHDLYASTSHMCQFGMTAKGEQGEGPVLKPTRWLTNSPCLATALDVKCSRDDEHVHLVSDRVKGAAVYPPALCRTIVKAFAEQLKADSIRYNAPSPCEPPVFNLDILQVDQSDELPLPDEASEGEDGWTASDDVHGGVLPAKLVQEHENERYSISRTERCTPTAPGRKRYE